MNKKAKGINAERNLLHKFWKNKWACIRVAGSGSQKYPSPDLIAGKLNRKLGIECKITSKEVVYLTKKEIEELKKFCSIFGLEPWIAVKFKLKDWLFLSLDDLIQTKNNYKIDLNLCKIKGFLFIELIEI